MHAVSATFLVNCKAQMCKRASEHGELLLQSNPHTLVCSHSNITQYDSAQYIETTACPGATKLLCCDMPKLCSQSLAWLFLTQEPGHKRLVHKVANDIQIEQASVLRCSHRMEPPVGVPRVYPVRKKTGRSDLGYAQLMQIACRLMQKSCYTHLPSLSKSQKSTCCCITDLLAR